MSLYWILLAGIPAVLASAALLLLPFSAPFPAYLRYAQEYSATGRIAETTFPAEYTWLTGLSIKAFGMRGAELLQTAFYLLIVVSIWALARKCGVGSRNALFAALAAALYPQLVVSVTKVWDIELAVLLMLCVVSMLRDGLRLRLVLASAVVFGLSLAQRSNMALLFPLPLLAVLMSHETQSRKMSALIGGGVLSVFVLIAVNTLAHGSFFLSQNGPYNLVQGHNEYTVQVILRDLTPEPTVPLIFETDGVDYPASRIIRPEGTI